MFLLMMIDQQKHKWMHKLTKITANEPEVINEDQIKQMKIMMKMMKILLDVSMMKNLHYENFLIIVDQKMWLETVTCL
jgi:hypothetical protein